MNPPPTVTPDGWAIYDVPPRIGELYGRRTITFQKDSVVRELELVDPSGRLRVSSVRSDNVEQLAAGSIPADVFAFHASRFGNLRSLEVTFENPTLAVVPVALRAIGFAGPSAACFYGD